MIDKKIYLYAVTIFLLAGLSLPATATNIKRISIDSSGNQSDRDSENPVISADGRYVTFSSSATNLVAGDTNSWSDIFVYDLSTKITTRVSLNSNGTQSDQFNINPAISADGRFITFESDATNLVTGDTNDRRDIFVHARDSSTTTRISVDSNGVQGNSSSFNPSISTDGRFVTFSSSATNLVTGDTNTRADIFVHDRHTNATTRVSVNSNGTQGNSGSDTPFISTDGRFVTFSSSATNLVTGDTNIRADIFVHDRSTSTTTRISVDSNGLQGDESSYSPSISADGRFVTFYSTATNLVIGNTNNATDIFVHDRNTSRTTRVSIDSNSVQGDNYSYSPSISADGRFVTFHSFATNLVVGDTNNSGDIFIHDRYTSITTRVNLGPNGIQANNHNYAPSISANGLLVAFQSYASNLELDDTNNNSDIFVANLPPPPQQDFNADGNADILWRHAVSGQNYLYMMDGTTVTNSGTINTVDDLNWKIVGSADFNADGKADILWRHAITGQNFVYLMDGSFVIDSGLINTVDDLNWKVTGVGDFDGDSKADILWRHSGTGQNFIYFMDGSSVAGSGLVNTVDDLSWNVAGIGDFDGDRKDDILWRNSTTGYNYLYLMDGVSVKSFAGINTVDDQNWQIKAVNDFNNDGKDDILWRHAGSGDNYLYMMNANAISSSGAVNTVADLNWKIEKADDFNGDGKADILWRHATTGENHLYIMNANSVTSSGTVNTVPDLNWEVQ